MSTYNLIECSDNHSKPCGCLWQYYRDEPHNALTDSESFKYKIKITGHTLAHGNTKYVEIT